MSTCSPLKNWRRQDRPDTAFNLPLSSLTSLWKEGLLFSAFDTLGGLGGSQKLKNKFEILSISQKLCGILVLACDIPKSYKKIWGCHPLTSPYFVLFSKEEEEFFIFNLIYGRIPPRFKKTKNNY